MQPTSCVRLPSQKVQRARASWLSLGSPATTVMCEEKEDSTVGEMKEEECSKEQVDSHIQRRSASLPRLRNSVLTTHSSPSPVRPCSPVPTRSSRPSPVRPGSPVPKRSSHPSPVRPGLADITNMQTSRHVEETLYLQKQTDDLKKRLAEYERGEQLSAYVAPHYHPYRAQGPPLPMSRAASPSPYGNFFSSPLAFILYSLLHLHLRLTEPRCQLVLS